MKPRPSIIESFNVAIEGLVHVLRTQRNMRIHFAAAVAVLRSEERRVGKECRL